MRENDALLPLFRSPLLNLNFGGKHETETISSQNELLNKIQVDMEKYHELEKEVEAYGSKVQIGWDKRSNMERRDIIDAILKRKRRKSERGS